RDRCAPPSTHRLLLDVLIDLQQPGLLLKQTNDLGQGKVRLGRVQPLVDLADQLQVLSGVHGQAEFRVAKLWRRLQVAQPIPLRMLVDVERNVLPVGRVLSQPGHFFQYPNWEYLRVEAARISAREHVANVVVLTAEEESDYLVNNLRVEER